MIQLDLQMKILVVEDFGVTRKLEIKALRKIGFQHILEATDGETAVDILKQESDVALVISDWNMPEMNGFELLKWIRRQEAYKELPFIMVTAQAEKKDADRVIKAGADDFITKPFTYEELKRVLEKLFQVKQDRDRDIPQKVGKNRIKLKIGHIQITDHLVLGVLKHMIDTEEVTPVNFVLETQCMSGWNPVQKSVERAEVDAALIMAPIAMDLYRSGAPIKLILLAHKNGSICVRNNASLSGEMFKDFCKGKQFYIPHVLSVHHMLSRMLFQEIGLKAGLVGQEALDVTFEVIPPAMMPEFLAMSEDACGFMVAQPIGTKTVFDGNAEMIFLSGQVWDNHPCCAVVMQEKIVEKYPEAVQELVDLLVRAGKFIEENPGEAAEIAVNFLDPEEELLLNVPMLKSVLSEPSGVKTDNLYPVLEDLDAMQQYMVNEMGIGSLVDLEKFVDLRFADAACQPSAESREANAINNFSEVLKNL